MRCEGRELNPDHNVFAFLLFERRRLENWKFPNWQRRILTFILPTLKHTGQKGFIKLYFKFY